MAARKVIKNPSRLLAEEILKSILDEGLAASTWRDNNELAYGELLKYREDMIVSAETVLKKKEKQKWVHLKKTLMTTKKT